MNMEFFIYMFGELTRTYLSLRMLLYILTSYLSEFVVVCMCPMIPPTDSSSASKCDEVWDCYGGLVSPQPVFSSLWDFSDVVCALDLFSLLPYNHIEWLLFVPVAFANTHQGQSKYTFVWNFWLHLWVAVGASCLRFVLIALEQASLLFFSHLLLFLSDSFQSDLLLSSWSSQL